MTRLRKDLEFPQGKAAPQMNGAGGPGVVHRGLARIRFERPEDLAAALHDEAFRLTVLRVVQQDAYIAPDQLASALARLRARHVWYHRA